MSSGAPQSTRRDDNLIVFPTRLRDIVPAFRNTTTSAERQLAKFRDMARLERCPARRGHRADEGEDRAQRVSIELRRQAFPRDGAAADPGKHIATVRLNHVAAVDDSAQVIDRCLDELVKLDTDCLLTLLAMIQASGENDGITSDDITDIGRRRGWQPGELDGRGRKSAMTRRERLRGHVQSLSVVEFVITNLTNELGRFVAFPLFQYVGREGKRASPGNERRFYKFHPLLWEQMTAKQRVVFLDESLLTADPRKHEWSFRLAWYMGSRWAPSWVSKGLYENGGRLIERLGVLLTAGHIDYQHQLNSQGANWLRRRFEAAMIQLLTWRPQSLIGGYDITHDAKSPLEDRVTFWPTEAVANRLTASRTRSIAKRESKNRNSRSPGTSK